MFMFDVLAFAGPLAQGYFAQQKRSLKSVSFALVGLFFATKVYGLCLATSYDFQHILMTAIAATLVALFSMYNKNEYAMPLLYIAVAGAIASHFCGKLPFLEVMCFAIPAGLAHQAYQHHVSGRTSETSFLFVLSMAMPKMYVFAATMYHVGPRYFTQLMSVNNVAGSCSSSLVMLSTTLFGGLVLWQIARDRFPNLI